MTQALVIGEFNDIGITSATLSTIHAATQLADKVDLLIAGTNLSAVIAHAQKIDGIKDVLVAEHAAYDHALSENMAALIVQFKDYQYILMSANTYGKNILPRVAGLLDVDMVSDVSKIIDANTFIRPIYAGNAQESVKITANPICLTIRPTAFTPATQTNNSAALKKIDTVCDLKLSQFIELKQDKNERPDLTQAKIVVSGGRALGSAENFKLIEQLADKLGGAIGATRAAVDAGYIANEYQVGQTGKVVAPDLYIAIGISGAIQHIAGMKDSKVIVAINKDKDAPIFQIADYGVVADLFEAIPEFMKKLEG
ncbi:MAG: FAD-binding protein [Gammaproteobacteria bacterium]|jgi:electron transfer flavoprotein alpha subunit